jgi:hypothetical protein
MVQDRCGARGGAKGEWWLGLILAALVMGLTGTSAWAQPGTPDIRGEYPGTGKISLSACTNRQLNQSNITFTPTIDVTQTAQNFTANASGPANVPGNSVVTFQAQLTGTITTGGTMTPTPPGFTFTIFQDGNALGSGSGTFTGHAGNDQVTFNITGNVTTGETCKVTGSMTGTRPTTAVAAAVLPASRSVQVGNPATAFATIINASATAGLSCQAALSTSLPAAFSFQATDPQTNQTIGVPNAPMDIQANQLQTFVVTITPSAAIAPTDVQFAFACANADNAAVISGVNTLLLSASDTPVPDVVALAATLQNDGIVHIPAVQTSAPGAAAFGTGVFAVATVNVGAGASITASADTGATVLPLSVQLCQTDPGTGLCLSTIGPSVTTQIGAGQTPTFGVFVQGNAPIAFDPANNRIFVRFKDAGGVTRGATSVAVQTQ